MCVCVCVCVCVLSVYTGVVDDHTCVMSVYKGVGDDHGCVLREYTGVATDHTQFCGCSKHIGTNFHGTCFTNLRSIAKI